MQHNSHVIDYVFSLPVADRLAAYHELIQHRPPSQHDAHVIARLMLPQHDAHAWAFRRLKQHDAHMEAHRAHMRGTWGNQCGHVNAYYADLVDGGPVYRHMAALMDLPKGTPEEQAARDKATEQELLAFGRELDPTAEYRAERNCSGKPARGSQWLSVKARAEAKKPKPKGGRKSRRKPTFYRPD